MIMKRKGCTYRVKRTLAGILVAGMLLTGIPALDVVAASEALDPTEAEITAGDESLSGNSPEKEPQIEDGEEKEEEKKEEEKEEQEKEEQEKEKEDADEESAEGDIPDAVYDTQVSGNDISGNDISVSANDLTACAGTAGDERRVVDGYIYLKEDQNVTKVDVSAQIDDYGEEIADLISGSAPPQKYTTSRLPETRNQGDYKNCWAHTAMSQAEIDMMQSQSDGGINSNIDYSERHLACFSYSAYSGDKTGPLCEGLEGDINTCDNTSDYMNIGGNLGLAQYVLASWVGAASERKVPNNAETSPDKSLAFEDEAHLQNAFQVDLQNNRDIAKRMIKKYGSLGTAYYDETQYFNQTYAGYYCNQSADANHAVTIVGWDDNFSRTKFNTTQPSKDGAWLVRNSWAEGASADVRDRDTYFWISYYDQSLKSGYAFDFEDANNYDHNYQYDGGMYTYEKPFGGETVDTANVFTVKDDGTGKAGEALTAVGVAFCKAQTPYTISIYKNVEKSADPENSGGEDVVTNPAAGTLVEAATTSGTCGCEGFYTIPLENPVLLSTGETFSVVVTYGIPQAETMNRVYLPLEQKTMDKPPLNCTVGAARGQSFRKTNDGWRDCAEDAEADGTGNLRIKAYTKDADSSNFPSDIELKDELGKEIGDSIKVGLGDTAAVNCTVLPETAVDRAVLWESDKPSIATVDQKGTIKGVSIGEAVITVSCMAKPSVKRTFKAVVSSELTRITIEGSRTVSAGSSTKLTAVPHPAGASLTGITWTSSNTSVVTVDSEGIVKGVAPGSAKITVASNSITAEATMTCEFPAISCNRTTSPEGITLTWNKAPGAKGYKLYRVAGEKWIEANKKELTPVTEEQNTCSYFDKDVMADTSYTYRIDAAVTYIDATPAEQTKTSSPFTVSMPSFYTITYDLDGGTNAVGNPSTFSSEQANVTLRNPVKTGYDFGGWYTDSDYKNNITVLSNSTATGDLTLYAKWIPHTYIITYENGGEHDNPLSYTIEDKKITLKPAVKEGYQFVAWYSDPKHTHEITEIETDGCQDITIYAEWIRKYTITYVLYGGTNDSKNKTSYTESDSAIPLYPATKDMGEFEGWYSDSQYKTQVTEITSGDNRDIILFAKWKGESAPVVKGIQIRQPKRTTYKVGEDADLSGGEMIINSDKDIPPLPMTETMLNKSFDSSRAGICQVTVTFEEYTAVFDALIVGEPKVNGYRGQKLSELTLPENDYGVYSWKNAETPLPSAGASCQMPVTFVPDDTDAFQPLDMYAQITLSPAPPANSLNAAKLTVQTLRSEPLTYTGIPQTPSVLLTLGGVTLVEGQDYTVSYFYNTNAGTANVHVSGCGDYIGGIIGSFVIKPAEVRIKAVDRTILIEEQIPAQEEYTYDVSGLLLDDKLVTEPVCSCSITTDDTKKAGQFPIVPSGADAGSNYTIIYEEGLLTVADEYLVYNVTFDMQGHGTAPAALHNIRAGSTIDRPEKPKDGEEVDGEGYYFAGWYQDVLCAKAWNFDTDIVQSNLTLYAKWRNKSTIENSQFQMQEIKDIYYYTGSALKPVVNIFDDEGKTLLKAGRDYTVKYVNNINANAGGVWKKGSGTGDDFNPALPYVQITGRGNYSDEIKVNFDIHPAVLADKKGNPAEKVVLRYTDQFTVSGGILRPFGSIRYIRGMKLDRDFTLSLTPINVRDDSGQVVPNTTSFAKAEIPRKYSGSFRLTVTGTGNYSGVIRKNVYVTDRLHLMKYAQITLGKNQKNVELTGRNVKLAPAVKDSADTFTVKLGKVILTPNKDYTISYLDNTKVGKATLVITGVGDYAGTKTTAFNIKGKPFTAGKIKVTGIEPKVYTGKAITQNHAVLVYNAGTASKPEERELKYGTDYTISYTRNINKGVATMTFTGLKEAGFSGSFRKTFRISAAPIDNMDVVHRADGWDAITVPYRRMGAKPDKEISLTNANNIILQNGKDYTLSYQNNRLLAKRTDEKAPTIIVRGRGNYQGTFRVPFAIVSADLNDMVNNCEITINTTAVPYQPNRSDDYAYKPTVNLLEGRVALRAGRDYTVTYKNNTQAEYNAYIESLANAGDASEASKLTPPQAVIRVGSENTYLVDKELIIPLTIYRNRLTPRNLKVEIRDNSQCVYTGTQLTPDVIVSYKGTDGKWTVLTENTDKATGDYTVTYGANIKSGKRGGRITISGTGTLYGGNVTVYFEITKKDITY